MTPPSPAWTTGQLTPGLSPATPQSPWSQYATPQESRSASRAGSIYPAGDFRNQTMEEINDIKCDVMVNWLHSQQEEKLWTTGEYEEGVALKKSRGHYTCAPADLADEPDGFFAAIQALNVRVAMTVNTRVIRILLHSNTQPFIEITPGLRIQVLPDISYLARCQKHQFAAFIADRGILCVWDDQPKKILARVERLELELMKMIWGNESAYPEENDEKKELIDTIYEVDEDDPEGFAVHKPRRIVLIQPFITAITLILVVSAIGSGWREVAIELKIDRDYSRLLFLVPMIPQIWLSLFFFQALAGNVAQIIGPIGQINENTKYYSGVAPRRLRRAEGCLPHVTIQCPVYKEGLHAVIEPTVRSIKAAISTYELQGGTANIFVNDDGLQLVPVEEAQARMDFYDEHNIGWVARPKHNPNAINGEKAFLRRGKFKKASNMNYAMWVSQRIEDKLATINRRDSWNQEDEAAAYKAALNEVIHEDEGRTWADGNVRIGDYILLIDSDTRVPTDCLLDAVSEMEQCPEVAIIQYNSGVMNVTSSFFERGITFFTNLIYTQIRYAVANGDVAPFVGHNAVLRWEAMQQIAYDCKDDFREKYWSEETVSEDFDMALRLQTNGYLVRLAAYTGDGFKEGVSLTVYDELNRWEKYAYGCNELLFHPLKYWFVKGPFTPLFKRFFVSKMPLPSKITILAYIGTYYAIGSAWALTLANYFLVGWFNGHLDHYYLDSFKVYVAIIVVFTGLGNLALAVLRYRSGEKGLLSALFENLSWIVMFTIFLGGISLHVSQAILSHMFGIDMSWGATSKEAEDIPFFVEIPRVVKSFKFTFIFCIAASVMMGVMAQVVPWQWRIDLLIAIFPLSTVVASHFLLPIALNPNLMLFTW
ncbi:hypothetical protein K402DRAFT_339995 [Aulographum hederae CBS 113979]|uniref:Uncharacterized protein n=1 Tax=Aulographum hederae CBS 113979 TaxID=1176131 RepID=A0A6G1GNY9_9PEZI|nr:hypothetical protein K402DRAFT_339995 [Aulographum hederae CBS 113979]